MQRSSQIARFADRQENPFEDARPRRLMTDAAAGRCEGRTHGPKADVMHPTLTSCQ
ncbi:hypothetical protein [Sphingobium baderi]|uniref:hypothetical protein n=1 Tax=Sphingobium baderi TaxID=1332080 RepID=UPI002B41373B|nr:hypothetical protein [Sphingobium baderi]WRD77190.1 hypothetical protein QQ987_03360 [Sphingobium baderi]